MPESSSHDREFDVVLFGVTGFTGRLVAEYISKRHGGGDLRWALAGRNQAKLEAVRTELGLDVPIVIADSSDKPSLAAMASRAAVICTTVGPYMKYGADLVAACIAEKTHYCDLTGEAPFIRQMMDRHHEAAVAAGTRIVHCCGFDSIPSDIGAWLLQETLIERDGAPADEVRLFVLKIRGGVSGGTIASMINIFELAQDKHHRRVLLHPYSLNPEDRRSGPARRSPVGAHYDAVTGWWAGPFVMAAINERVVRRSNALLGDRYGAELLYTEASRTGRGLKGRLGALQMSAAMGAFFGAIAVKPIRMLLERFVLPAPGQGPSRDRIDNGYFKILLSGRRDGVEVGRVVVDGRGDPGYGATSCMLAESAICLARDPLEGPGGILTPAAAMGRALMTRLNGQDVTFTFEPVSES
jgi:short subunit dehydrogenase-like uncharacterized protein